MMPFILLLTGGLVRALPLTQDVVFKLLSFQSLS